MREGGKVREDEKNINACAGASCLRQEWREATNVRLVRKPNESEDCEARRVDPVRVVSVVSVAAEASVCRVTSRPSREGKKVSTKDRVVLNAWISRNVDREVRAFANSLGQLPIVRAYEILVREALAARGIKVCE